jgi:nitrate/TMAO reductase-like tetraheme cytochrome c subunit
MNENCGACKQDYEITPANGQVVLYLNYSRANHVLATCPNCEAVEVIYLKPTAVMEILKLGQFQLAVGDKPNDDRRHAAEACWARFEGSDSESEPKAWDELPVAPREWVRQLHDDLRNWGRSA